MRGRLGMLMGVISVAAVLVAIVVGVVAGWAFVPEFLYAEPAEPDDISGVVMDESTRDPIAGALVSVWRRDRPRGAADGDAEIDLDWPARASRSVRTDARGAFRFQAGPKVPLRWITMSASGYMSAAVEVPEGRGAWDVFLRAGPPQKGRFMRPGPTGPVPAAGAEILLFSRGPRPLLVGRYAVGTDGVASIPCLMFDLRVARGPGIATQVVFGEEAGRDSHLTVGGPVAGIVTRPNGTPVVGVAIKFGPILWTAATVTDASGRFRAEGVPTTEIPSRLTLVGRGLIEVPIMVQGGDLAVRVVAVPPARVAGRVVDADGRPVAGATVQVFDASIRDLRRADPERLWTAGPTGPDGRFEVTGPAPGPTVFRADAAGDAYGMTTAVIPVGARCPDVEVRVARHPVSVAVRVLDDESGRPIPDIAIVEEGGTLPVKTDRDGAADVPLLLGMGSWGRELEVTSPREGDPKGSFSVSIEKARAGRVDVVLVRRPVRLRIHAVEADGTRVADARIQLDRIRSVPGGPTLVILGQPPESKPGSPRLVPRSAPFHLMARSMVSLAAWAGVCRGSGGTGDFLDQEIRFPGPGRVRGRIGAPAPGADIVALASPVGSGDARPTEPRSLERAVGAEFGFRSLAPGAWCITVADGNRPEELLALRQIRVPESGCETDLGDVQQPLVTLRGTVRSRGHAVPGVSVRVRFGSAPPVAALSTPVGDWALRLPAGSEGSVEFVRDGWGAVRRSFKADADTTLDAELVPTGTLVLTGGRDRFGQGLPVRVRAGGVETTSSTADLTGNVVVRTATPGRAEILVGAGSTARTLSAEVPADGFVIVDLVGE